MDVKITISPLPQTLPPERMDELFEGELEAFDKWFIERQRANGGVNPTGIINVERSILKTYLIYLHTKG